MVVRSGQLMLRRSPLGTPEMSRRTTHISPLFGARTALLSRFDA
jgi:hypothetical protein